MNASYEIQRFASRVATVLLLPAWGGFVYTLLNRPHHVSLLGVTAWLPDVGFVTVATLLCSLITFVCSLPALDEDITSFSDWLFTLACALPFFGMVWLLEPLGATPSL